MDTDHARYNQTGDLPDEWVDRTLNKMPKPAFMPRVVHSLKVSSSGNGFAFGGIFECSLDGKWLAFEDFRNAGVLSIVDTRTFQDIFPLMGREAVVSSVSFFEFNGKTMLIGLTRERKLPIWDIETRRCIKTLELHPDAKTDQHSRFYDRYICASPRGDFVIAQRDSLLQMFDIRTGERVGIPDIDRGSLICAFHPTNPSILAICGADPPPNNKNRVLIWDIFQQKLIKQLDCDYKIPCSVCFSSIDEDHLIVSYGGFPTKTWDISTGKVVREFAVPPCGQLQLSRFHGILFSKRAEELCLWDIRTGELLAQLRDVHNEFALAAILPVGDKVVIATTRAEFMAWDLFDSNPARDGPYDELLAISRFGETVLDRPTRVPPFSVMELATNNPVLRMCFSPDSKFLLTGEANGWVNMWDVGTNETIANWDDLCGEHDVTDIHWSPSGEYITASAGDKIAVWNWAQGYVYLHDCKGANTAQFSPDSTKLLGGGRDGGGRVYIWDVETRKMIKSRSIDADTVGAARYSPDGRVICINSPNEDFCYLDSGSLATLYSFMQSSRMLAVSTSFSPDNNHVAGCKAKDLFVYDNPGRPSMHRCIRRTDYAPNNVCYHPGGRFIAVGGNDGLVHLYDTEPDSAIMEHVRPESMQETEAKIGQEIKEKVRREMERLIREEVEYGFKQATEQAIEAEAKQQADSEIALQIRVRQLDKNDKNKQRKIRDEIRKNVEWEFRGKRRPDNEEAINREIARRLDEEFKQRIRQENKTINIEAVEQRARAGIKEFMVLKGHKRSVRCVCFSPDGDLAASTSGDKTYIWDILGKKPSDKYKNGELIVPARPFTQLRASFVKDFKTGELTDPIRLVYDPFGGEIVHDDFVALGVWLGPVTRTKNRTRLDPLDRPSNKRGNDDDEQTGIPPPGSPTKKSHHDNGSSSSSSWRPGN